MNKKGLTLKKLILNENINLYLSNLNNDFGLQ